MADVQRRIMQADGDIPTLYTPGYVGVWQGTRKQAQRRGNPLSRHVWHTAGPAKREKRSRERSLNGRSQPYRLTAAFHFAKLA